MDGFWVWVMIYEIHEYYDEDEGQKRFDEAYDNGHED